MLGKFQPPQFKIFKKVFLYSSAQIFFLFSRKNKILTLKITWKRKLADPMGCWNGLPNEIVKSCSLSVSSVWYVRINMEEGYRRLKMTSQTPSNAKTASFSQWNVHCWVTEKQKHCLSRRHFTNKNCNSWKFCQN